MAAEHTTMKAWTIKKVGTAVAGIIPVIFLISACGQKQPAPVVRHYQFYPKANIYFDPQESDYTFYDKETKSWQTGKNIPDSIKTLLGKNVAVTRAQPWRDNEAERMVAAVKLYALPADFIEKPARQIYTVSPVINQSPPTTDQPRESGVKRFFKKLFGKKNKKDTLEIQ